MRVLALIPFLSFSTLIAEPPAWLVGDWVNVDSGTRGITRLKVDQTAAGLRIAAWGSCQPVDCDWGFSDIGERDGFPSATWNHGFSITQMQLSRAPGGRLIAVLSTEFKDNSGRGGSDRIDVLVREKLEAASPQQAELRALLTRAAGLLRKMPSAYFEADTYADTEGETLSQRSASTMRAWVGAAGRVRLETTPSNGGDSTVLLVDDRSSWKIFPATNEYTVLPRPSDPLTMTDLHVLTLVDTLPGKLSDGGNEVVSGHPCRKLVIAAKPGGEYRVWVEGGSGIVWRYEIASKGERSSSLEGLTFRKVDIGLPTSDELFVFNPARSKAVDRGAVSSRSAEQWEGQPAPDFELASIEGVPMSLKALRGKSVLLDFWGTWCGACRAAMPMLELVHRQFRDKGLIVLAVDSEDPDTQRSFLQKNRYTMIALHDKSERVTRSYGVSVFPTTVLIGGDGKILWRRVGSEGEDVIRQQLVKLGIW